MTLLEFFDTYDTDQLVVLYAQITAPEALDIIKDIIKDRLDLPDDDSFYLWYKLY